MLRGSQDAGAQLFCALLRYVGVKTRLVCSLQPLSISGISPSVTPKLVKPTIYLEAGSTSDGSSAEGYASPVLPMGSTKGGSRPLVRRIGHTDISKLRKFTGSSTKNSKSLVIFHVSY